MAPIDSPVLIVGGGPVGLALAIDLGWRRIPTILVEQDGPDARLEHPRMDNVGIRTMEFCRRWGIGPAVQQAGFPCDLPISIVYTTGVLGHELARDEYPDKATAVPPPFSPEKHELCPQNFFDPVLQAAAASNPETRLLYKHKLVGFEQHDDYVDAIVEALDDGNQLQIRSSYLAACDGAGSFVSQQLGITPSTASVLSCSTNIFIRCPALAQRTTGKRAYRYILIGPEGIWGSMVNINGRDVWRLQLIGSDAWPAWSPEEIDAFVKRGIGADVDYELLSWLPWSRREYVASRFREDRCFLVGDAAHQLSPTGGYGMNTGIAEAVDLSWKLAAVIEGWGRESLLDSYDIERRPIAARNVRQASENLASMRSVPAEPRLLDEGLEGTEARQAIGTFTQAAMQREWKSFGIHLGAVYRSSPLILEEEDEDEYVEQDVMHFGQSARPGARAPHVWLSPGKSILDLFGRGFVVLDFSGTTESALADLLTALRLENIPMNHVPIEHAEAQALYARRYVIVRPDGHVTWRGNHLPTDTDKLIKCLRGDEASSPAHASAKHEPEMKVGGIG
ncbi:FAD-dependent oxidoreductase [Novosphingobium sp.]|uniref:FAD-dependent oxidoreductase n=1 Tax=Novosphingobium sp. TaxID=1874826 RepID=UPI002FE0485D